MAKRNERALDDREQSQRLDPFRQDAGAGRRQRNPQALVRRWPRLEPGGRPGEGCDHGEKREHGGRAVRVARPCGERRGEEAEPAEHAQAVPRREEGQKADDQESAESGADEIGPVDRRDFAMESDEGQSDPGPRGAEREGQQQIDLRQTDLLVGVPDDLERVEGHALRQRESADGQDCEQHRATGEGRREPGASAPRAKARTAPLAPMPRSATLMII